MILKKALTTAIVATTVLAGTVSMAFSDISGHWAESTINTLSNIDIIDGYQNGTFLPDNKITREEAAKLIWGIKKSKLSDYSNEFSDVDSRDWSAKYIAALSKQKVIEGYEDGLFRPQNNITRAEFSKMVHDLLISYDDLNFNYVYLTDMGEHWSDSKVSILIGASVVSGYPDITFKHDNPITRAEASRVVLKSIELLEGTIDKPVRPDEEPVKSGVKYPPAEASPEGFAYEYSNGWLIANKNSGIFHAKDQRDYKKILNKNAEFYETEAEAEKAGYRKAMR